MPQKPDGAIRFATFNASLHGEAAGEIAARLSREGDAQARMIAEIIQRVRPDVLLLQELDRDEDGAALEGFARNYLAVGQNGAAAIDLPHRLVLPTNTGMPSGIDLSGDGIVGGEGLAYALDAKGFGRYPGQYGFAILSALPLGTARTFTDFLWRDMPGDRMPPQTPQGVREVLPLSSKTHALIPVDVGDATIWIAAAHPTPPIREPLEPRNADEIRLLVDLLHEARSRYAADDAGVRAGLPADSHAVVMGDLNADPRPGAGDGLDGAIGYLLDDPMVQDPRPSSATNGTLTAQFRRGKMRVDYVVPTRSLTVLGSGVFWPPEGDPLNEASDHRLVYVDVARP